MMTTLPFQKMDTIQNLMKWRGEMANLDRILEDVVPSAPSRPNTTSRAAPPFTAASPLLTVEEARLVAEAMAGLSSQRTGRAQAEWSSPSSSSSPLPPGSDDPTTP